MRGKRDFRSGDRVWADPAQSARRPGERCGRRRAALLSARPRWPLHGRPRLPETARSCATARAGWLCADCRSKRGSRLADRGASRQPRTPGDRRRIQTDVNTRSRNLMRMPASIHDYRPHASARHPPFRIGRAYPHPNSTRRLAHQAMVPRADTTGYAMMPAQRRTDSGARPRRGGRRACDRVSASIRRARLRAPRDHLIRLAYRRLGSSRCS